MSVLNDYNKCWVHSTIKRLLQLMQSCALSPYRQGLHHIICKGNLHKLWSLSNTSVLSDFKATNLWPVTSDINATKSIQCNVTHIPMINTPLRVAINDIVVLILFSIDNHPPLIPFPQIDNRLIHYCLYRSLFSLGLNQSVFVDRIQLQGSLWINCRKHLIMVNRLS